MRGHADELGDQPQSRSVQLGHLTFYLIRVSNARNDQTSLHTIFDSRQETSDAFDALYSTSYPEFRPAVQRQFEDAYPWRDVLLLHYLTEVHYRWLMDIHNQLAAGGVSLTVFLVGQRELLHKRSGLRAGGQGEIVGRFMCHDRAFRGLHGVEQMKKFLAGYDEAVYPVGGAVTFTGRYFPEAWEEGWRLESLAGDLWAVFEAMHQRPGLGANWEIPMQYCCCVAAFILRHYGPKAGRVPMISRALLRDAVCRAGYEEYLSLSVLVPAKKKRS